MATFQGSLGADTATPLGLSANWSSGSLATLTDTQGDLFLAGGGDDSISAGNASDMILGEAGSDTLFGNGGDDIFRYAATSHIANDSISGGFGKDTLEIQLLSSGGAPFSADFRTATFNSAGAGAAIERLQISNASGSVGSNVTFWAEQVYANGISSNLEIAGNTGADIVTFVMSTSTNFSAVGFRFENWTSADGLVIIGDTSDETIQGSSFSDTFSGGNGADRLVGGDGNDAFRGGNGADDLEGGSGNDVFVYMSQSEITGDAINGGSDDGFGDIIQVQFSGFADFRNAIFQSSGVTSIERIEFYSTDNTALFDAPQFSLSGLSTALHIQGVNGRTDQVKIELKAETVFFGDVSTVTEDVDFNASQFAFSFWEASDSIQLDGTDGNNRITGSDNADNIIGKNGNDTINGGAGNDTIVGGANDDIIDGGAGTDSLDGEAGFDLVSFASFSPNTGVSGVTVFMSINTVQFGGSTITTETFSNFEGVIGSSFNDAIGGTDNADMLRGGAGNDVLNGFAGADSIYGESGADIVRIFHTSATSNVGTVQYYDGGQSTNGLGVEDKDSLAISGNNTDTIFYLAFDTIVNFEELFFNNQFGNGAKVLFTAEQFAQFQTIGSSTRTDKPILMVVGMEALTTIDLSGKTFFVGQTGDALTILGDEDNESITGSTLNDSIRGEGGTDVIQGGGGNDTLDGGLGNDTLNVDSGDGDYVGEVFDGGADIDTLRVTLSSATQFDLRDDSLTGLERLIVMKNSLTETSVAFTASQFAQFDSLNVVGLSINGPINIVIDMAALTSLNLSLVALQGAGHPADRFTISGDDNNELITGFVLGDSITGGFGNDTLRGENGEDTLRGEGGNDELTGDVGDDQLFGGDDQDLLWGWIGKDLLRGENGNDTAFGEGGDDTLTGDVGDDQLFGGDDQDRLFGWIGNDLLRGENGNDTAFGEGGDDTLTGDVGDDQLFGGDDQDRLFGWIGNDLLRGDNGNDTAFGEGGDDTLTGDVGEDQLFGGDDQDRLFGWIGNDLLRGENGNDTAFGEGGDDTLTGDVGDDQLFGGDDQDRLWGWIGADLLDGGFGNDTLRAEGGDDIVAGGRGNDLMNGGGGLDRFFFWNNEIAAGELDRIEDFETIDRYHFQNGANVSYRGIGGGAAIDVAVAGGTFTVDVVGATIAQLQAQTIFF